MLLAPTLMHAKDFNFQSAEDKAQLIELYTSQGCSSCPPAERKLSKLVNNKELWQQIVPIAFHVDYWNYLGWRDIYSSSKSTQRQQLHHANGNVYNLYTPQFVVDGKEWRGFFKGDQFQEPSTERSGVLSLNWNFDSERLSMTFNNQSKQQPATCLFSLLSFEDAIKIHSGENRNLTIDQDFSSLAIIRSDIEVKNHHYVCQADSNEFNKLYLSPNKGQRFAIVGWVSSPDESHIQATGGWL